jgi:hypothetical protein
MTTTAARPDVADTGGPKYHVDIEGTLYPWDRDTITVPEIRSLGGLPTGTAVEEINLDTNTQRTLAESDVVELKPGLGFSKKIKFGRG